MVIQECVYCYKEVEFDENEPVPEADNDEEWERIAKSHHSDCEWAYTRGHQVLDTVYWWDQGLDWPLEDREAAVEWLRKESKRVGAGFKIAPCFHAQELSDRVEEIWRRFEAWVEGGMQP